VARDAAGGVGGADESRHPGMSQVTTSEAVARADKKLRQARFFLGHLREISRKPGQGEIERMEFYLSACLSAAQERILCSRDHAGNSFNREHQRWRMSPLKTSGLS